MLRRDGVGVFGGVMINMDSRAAYWTGYVMGQISRDMDAAQIVEILYKAFDAVIHESKKDTSS
jgi:hypothetical protein